MKALTQSEFNRAVETHGSEIAASALNEAVSAYNCNAIAGFDRRVCKSEEYAAWCAFLAASERMRG